MCKVCRLWGVLSLALFSYACRPNFHHKHLTLSDPSLSVCEEALISPHTCADRPKILKLGLCMKACFYMSVCVCVWKKSECLHSCICVHAWMFQAIQDYPPCSNYSAHSLFPLFAVSSLLPHSPALLRRTTQFIAERNHLYRRVAQSGHRLRFVSALFFLRLYQLPLFISRGSDEANKAK